MFAKLTTILILLVIVALVGCVFIAGRNNRYQPSESIDGSNRVTKIEVKPH